MDHIIDDTLDIGYSSNFNDIFPKNLSSSPDFSSYSDLYFKHNRILPNILMNLKKFVQTERNLLLSNEYFYSTNFVPFYQNTQRKYQHKGLCSYNPKLFNNYVPIFSPLMYNSFKSAKECYISRISLGLKKRRAKNLDLDEILQIREETPQNQEADNLIEAHYERNELLLDPLSLNFNARRDKKHKLSQSEHKKIVRITILYVLAFFALALVTFFSLYLL